MRVLYVWDADYPWDVRTQKVCRALTEGGHQVIIAARNRRGDPPVETLAEGLVERLTPSPRLGRIAREVLTFPLFLNPLWIAHIRRLIRRQAVDLVIVRDLPLALAARMAAGRSVPVIMDMAENYPAMILDIWTDRRWRLLDALVRNPLLVSAIERLTLPRMDHIVTVVDESRHRLHRMGIPEDRTSVVSNTPRKARVSPPAGRVPGEPMRINYLGLMEVHRGVADLLEAAHRLVAEGVPFHLDLVGDGRDAEQFRARAEALRLDASRVVFHGRLPHEAALTIVSQAHVGVVPHHARESWNTTIPNKLFDYMAAGLAVVSSDAAPAARIIRETGAGLVFASGDAVALAKQISQLQDVSRCTAYGRAGQVAVSTLYNWEHDAGVLLDVVQRVQAQHARAVR